MRSYYALARREGMNVGYVQRLMQLAFLSPNVIEAIIANRPLHYGNVVDLNFDEYSPKLGTPSRAANAAEEDKGSLMCG